MTNRATAAGGPFPDRQTHPAEPLREDAFAEARELEWFWKTDAMRRMALALVELALSRDEFAADDLPPELEHGGTGIAGSVMATLVNHGIIRRAGVWAGGQFYGKERASRRPGRKDAKLKVFTLACAGRARAFLQANHRCAEFRQAELPLAAGRDTPQQTADTRT